MAKQTINIGTAPNTGTGEPLRGAFNKINENFTEVYDIAQSSFDSVNVTSILAQSAFEQANTVINPFNQDLNTTNSVIFNDITTPNIISNSVTFSDNSIQTVAYSGGQGRAMMIDTNRTDSYQEVGSADRPFKTFAAAIAAAEDSDDTSYTFILMGCTVTEDVNFSNTSFTSIAITTTCRSIITGNVTIANISSLSQMVVRNIEVGGTFAVTGDGTTNQMNSVSFYNASFTGPVNITATNATAFYEAAFFGPVTFSNVNYVYINGAQYNSDWTLKVDDSGSTPVPSNGITPCIVVAFNLIANNIIMTKVGGGAGFMVFQPHMARMGRAGSGAVTYTVPAGWFFQPHGCTLRGTWVNNGNSQFRNTNHDNPIGGTSPTYVGTIGASLVKFEDGTSQSTSWSGGRVIAAPSSSVGVIGDREGDLAFDSSYFYYCANDYDGVTSVWKRVAWSNDTW
jgi:hypothetical protein